MPHQKSAKLDVRTHRVQLGHQYSHTAHPQILTPNPKT